MLTNRRTAAALGTVVLAGALLCASPAQADAGAGAPSAAPPAGSAPKSAGAEALCKRLPKVEARVAAALTRLNGDATVSGSIARLEKRVAEAKAAGHTEVHTYLNNRLTVRKGMPATLQQRQADLKGVSAWCAARGTK
ncbi:hypothetical protein ACFV7Q_11540 [Streptomyces sp. NPDC059851]|uniref:hypothetical protein n=1 Tax=Streptomyces sp. NPDC059851 TaxID=3346971 RepID=UPI00364E1D19